MKLLLLMLVVTIDFLVALPFMIVGFVAGWVCTSLLMGWRVHTRMWRTLDRLADTPVKDL